MQMDVFMLMLRPLYLHIFLDLKGYLKYQGEGRVLIVHFADKWFSLWIAKYIIITRETSRAVHWSIAAQLAVYLQIIAC